MGPRVLSLATLVLLAVLAAVYEAGAAPPGLRLEAAAGGCPGSADCVVTMMSARSVSATLVAARTLPVVP